MCEKCEDFINGVDSDISLPVHVEHIPFTIGGCNGEIQAYLWLDSLDWHNVTDPNNFAMLNFEVRLNEGGDGDLAHLRLPIRFCPFCGEELKVKSTT